jgi:activator of 2-hydroxyglutaryl-CoA dehydratase
MKLGADLTPKCCTSWASEHLGHVNTPRGFPNHEVTLALGHVLRKKAKIKEEERQSMKCTEGTQTEEGSKWLKKKKRRNEVKESKLLKEKIKEDKATKKIDHGQVSKQKKILMGALEHLTEKKEEQVDEVLKNVGLCGPRVLAPRVLTPRLRSRVV